MEILTHSGMYDITFSNPQEIYDLKKNLLEGEIFDAEEIPHNPTGKKLSLKVNLNLKKRIEAEIVPHRFCSWEKLKEIYITLSEEAYNHILFGEPFQSQAPETFIWDILINANHYAT